MAPLVSVRSFIATKAKHMLRARNGCNQLNLALSIANIHYALHVQAAAASGSWQRRSRSPPGVSGPASVRAHLHCKNSAVLRNNQPKLKGPELVPLDASNTTSCCADHDNVFCMPCPCRQLLRRGSWQRLRLWWPAWCQWPRSCLCAASLRCATLLRCVPRTAACRTP